MEEKKIKTDEEIMEDARKNREEAGLPKMRQIIIETDGNNINLVKAEVAGNLELSAILNALLAHLNKR